MQTCARGRGCFSARPLGRSRVYGSRFWRASKRGICRIVKKGAALRTLAAKSGNKRASASLGPRARSSRSWELRRQAEQPYLPMRSCIGGAAKMKSLEPCRYTLAFGKAAALLPGCGGPQQPVGEAGTAIPTAGAVARASSRSWMLQSARSGDLLYASNPYGPYVYAYSYPGGKLTGELTDFASGYYPQGLCTNRAGDVLVTAPQDNNSSQSNIYEYAHGGTSPLATLSDSGWALACAVDPTTGKLAVANAYTSGNGPRVLRRSSERLASSLRMHTFSHMLSRGNSAFTLLEARRGE